MTNLYLTVEVKDNLKDSKEVIKYYLTKDESYGFKITITSSENLVEEEECSIKNITVDKDKIMKLVKLIEISGTEFSQVNDIVEDFLSQEQNKKSEK